MLYPVPAAIAVVVHDRKVLLVRRANPPDVGYWGFPGGKINVGEGIAQAATRELFEETGIEGQATSILTALDAFSGDAEHSTCQHFILVAVLCRWLSGTPAPADDALETGWFSLDALQDTNLLLSKDVAKVAHMGISYMATARC